MAKPRIVFAGTGMVGAACLVAVAEAADITLVVTQPVRGGKTSPVFDAAKKLNLAIETPIKIKELLPKFNSLLPDLLVVADYGEIIPTDVLTAPKFGAMNAHPSLLPRHRGPAPDVATIIAGDMECGVTIIQMDSKMDHGSILAQAAYPLVGNESMPEFRKLMSARAAELLAKTIEPYVRGQIQSREQDHAQASFHNLLKREDGEVTSENLVVDVERKVRAFQPWPGVFFKINLRGRERILKILEANIWLEGSTLNPGKFFWSDNRLGLGFKDGSLELKRVQLDSSNVQTGEQFYRGYNDIIT